MCPSKMETDHPSTFTERMLRRASTRTLPRRRKIMKAIDDEHEVQPVIVDPIDRDSFISSLSTEIKDLEQKIESLERKDRELLLETPESTCPPLLGVMETREIMSDTGVIEEKVAAIGETPKLKRRARRPIMESTRVSLTTSNEPTTSPTAKSPMQVSSTISSIQVAESREDKIPYEVERFLEDALGDELNNTTITYGEQSEKERSDSQFNASELISEERTPFYKRITRAWTQKRTDYLHNATFSLGVRNTSTLDRSVRLYRSLSERIKKTIRATIKREKTPEAVTPSEVVHQVSFDEERMSLMEDILKHMKLQQSIIEQASKALKVCRMSREFAGSFEEVESERLLLIAEIRKYLLQEELKKLSCTLEDTPHADEAPDVAENAEVTVAKVNLALRECLRREPWLGEPVEWFVAVLIQGTNVWASYPVRRPVNSMRLEFTNFVTVVHNLKPIFKIVLKVYGLKLKAGEVYNHEDKYHIVHPRMERTLTCPSPKKLLKRIEKHTSPRNKSRSQEICSSSFVMCGQLELGLPDLRLSPPWPLTAVPHGSVLLGTVDVSLSCKLYLSICHQGFLNYGEEAGGFVTWNRRWCVLKGNIIMLWNYPREQESKPPVRSIDLVHCTDERIAEVNRELCAKPRTIVVETVRMREVGDIDSILVACRQTYTVERHLLSYDSRKDLNEWTTKLNHVISALRDWNVIFMTEAPKTPMVSEL